MADLGQKHTCFKCGSKFYDLKKPRALCPKCGADQVDAPAIAAPPPPPPAKRGPRMVDPVEEEVAPDAVDDDAEPGADADLDVEGDDDAAGAVEEDPDEAAGGGDSYE